MKKLVLIAILSVFFSSCTTKTINIATVKLNTNLYEIISNDTTDILNEYIKPNLSKLIIYSKNNNFFNNLEQHLRIAGYSVFIPDEEIILKEGDYLFSYILDVINSQKIDNNLVRTLRYSFILNKTACSKLYEINNSDELLYKSDWVCLLGE